MVNVSVYRGHEIGKIDAVDIEAFDLPIAVPFPEDSVTLLCSKYLAPIVPDEKIAMTVASYWRSYLDLKTDCVAECQNVASAFEVTVTATDIGSVFHWFAIQHLDALVVE